jgi:hypothetical protein
MKSFARLFQPYASNDSREVAIVVELDELPLDPLAARKMSLKMLNNLELGGFEAGNAEKLARLSVLDIIARVE